MSKKDLDLIIRSAFNDNEDGDEKLLVERIAQDQSTQAQLDKMSALRSGLKSLADIPECQLSSERLRQTILDQGVKPRRPAAFNWWKYALPAAAMATVAWMILPNFTTKANAPVAIKDTVQQPTQVDPVELDENVVASASSAATRGAVSGLLDRAVKPDDLAEKTPVIDSAPAPTRTIAPRNTTRRARKLASATLKSTDIEVNKVATSVASLVTDHVSGIVATETAPSANRTAIAADSASIEFDAKSKPESNIVVVESKSNTANGIPRAVEKQNNDIVFGG